MWFERVFETTRVRPYFDADGYTAAGAPAGAVEDLASRTFEHIARVATELFREWFNVDISWKDNFRPSSSHTASKASCHVTIAGAASLRPRRVARLHPCGRDRERVWCWTNVSVLQSESVGRAEP